MDHISVVVDDLPADIAFFTALALRATARPLSWKRPRHSEAAAGFCCLSLHRSQISEDL